MKKLLTVSILAVALNLTFAHKSSDDPATINAHISQELMVHRAGELELSMTNFGVLGSFGGDLFNAEINQAAPSAVFPSQSGINYLFIGALWIGAVVEDSLEPGRQDTLVSVGDDGWLSHIYEFSPPDISHESIRRGQGIADEEIVAIYYDTTTESVGRDPVDNRDHRPLGLKITQRSLAWNSRDYNQYIVINYYIENIYSRDLKDVWAGIYYDSEICEAWETSLPQKNDDLCGSFDHAGRTVVWTADNDGHPVEGRYRDDSPDDVLAVLKVGSSSDDLMTNFNWWTSNSDPGKDWGPQWRANYSVWGDFEGGGRGTPMGDAAKYRVMSNGEIDYDQAFSGLDWTKAGWIENDPNFNLDLADGFDTRYLLSFGPFDLTAGAVETLTVALVAGQSLHRDPDNFNTYLNDHTGDSLYIAAFYNNLDFTRLLANIDTVLNSYETGFEKTPPGPPDNFHVDSWGIDHIVLNWNRSSHKMLGEYRIYRGVQSEEYDPVPITPPGFSDTTFTDYDVSDNTVYHYVVSSVNIFGDGGDFSDEISINTGQPQTPSGISIKPQNGHVEIEWEPNPDEDLYGYILFRKSSNELDFSPLDTVIFNSHIDNNLLNGISYSYRMQAIDIYGNMSYFSKPVRATPMAFDSGIMLINANSDNYEINPDYESMQEFYENMLGDYPHVIVYECPDELTQLSPYSTVIWCKEIAPGRIQFDDPLGNYTQLFADYLDAGGQLILAGSRLVKYVSSAGEFPFLPHEFQYKYLHLAGIDLPEIKSSEFTGGFSIKGAIPGFNIDSTKASRLIYPDVNETGRLYGIGALIPRDTAEVIYRYDAVQFDTSRYYGRPVATIHTTGTYKTAVIEFPLYYIREPVSFEIIYDILDYFGERVPVKEFSAPIPEAVELMQNFPNPFNFKTEIKYILPRESRVRLEIFDILGRSIVTLVDELQVKGVHSVIWDGRSTDGVLATSGIYFYRLTAGEYETAKRMVYLK